jgi:hypothetical protein
MLSTIAQVLSSVSDNNALLALSPDSAECLPKIHIRLCALSDIGPAASAPSPTPLLRELFRNLLEIGVPGGKIREENKHKKSYATVALMQLLEVSQIYTGVPLKKYQGSCKHLHFRWQ